MAWTQADLDALDAAIATGARIVDYGDRRIAYHSLDEMLKLRAVIVAALAPQQAANSWPPQRRLARFASGLASSTSCK